MPSLSHEGDAMSAAVIRGALLAIIALTPGCDTRTPITPSTSPAADSAVPSAERMPTLTGTVYEATREGRRPLAGIPLDISVDYQQRSPVTTTDADGQYRFFGSSLEKWNVRVEKAGYSQPCRAAKALNAESVMDVYVVSDATLALHGVPASMPVIQPTLSGTVFERALEVSARFRVCRSLEISAQDSDGDRARPLLPMRLVGTSCVAWTGVWTRTLDPALISLRHGRYSHDHEPRHRPHATITSVNTFDFRCGPSPRSRAQGQNPLKRAQLLPEKADRSAGDQEKFS